MNVNADLEIAFENFNIYYPKIVEPLAKPSDFGIGPREFFYWIKQGVIDIQKSETGQIAWNRLNMYDAIWIRFIQELRTFNLPFKDIVKLKAQLFYSGSSLMYTTPESALEYALIEKYGAIKGKEYIKEIQAIKADPSKLSEALKNKYDTVLVYLICAVFTFQHPIKIHILINGENVGLLYEGLEYKVENDDSLNILEEQSHLTINFHKLVAEFLVDIRFEKMNRDFGFISENEKILFDALKDKSIREINIKKDQHNNTKFELKSTKELRDDEVVLLKKLLRMNHYEEVRVVYRNDSHIILQNTHKIKTTTP
jgi:hypothetical protein